MARTVRGMRPCCPQKVAICNNGYTYVATWEDFLKYSQLDMDMAFRHKEQTASYKIVKSV